MRPSEMFDNLSTSNLNNSYHAGGGSRGRWRYVPIMTLADPALLWACGVVVALLIVVGLCGNAMSFLVLHFSPKRTCSNVYLQALAIADSCVLLFAITPVFLTFVLRPLFPRDWPPFTLFFNRWLACQAVVFFSFLVRTMATYIIVLFTMERCVNVLRPLRASSWFTARTARRNLLLVLALAVVLAIPGLFTKQLTTRPGAPRRCRPNRLFYVFVQYQLVTLSLLPSVLIVVCNLLIAVFLRRRSRTGGLNRRQSLLGRQEVGVTRRLLLVSSAFVLLTAPVMLMSVTTSARQLLTPRRARSRAEANALAVCMSLWAANFAANFALYCFSSRRFRRAARALWSCDAGRVRSALAEGPGMAPAVGRRGSSPSVSTRSTALTGRTLVAAPGAIDDVRLRAVVVRAARERSASPGPGLAVRA